MFAVTNAQCHCNFFNKITFIATLRMDLSFVKAVCKNCLILAFKGRGNDTNGINNTVKDEKCKNNTVKDEKCKNNTVKDEKCKNDTVKDEKCSNGN